MVLELAAAGYSRYAAAAPHTTSHAGMTVVLVVLIAALAIVFWRVTLRLIGIAILTLLISGAVMAFHMHG